MKKFMLKFASDLLSKEQMRAIKGGVAVYCSCCGTPWVFHCTKTGSYECSTLCARIFPYGCNGGYYAQSC
jgi:hypothetical protein